MTRPRYLERVGEIDMRTFPLFGPHLRTILVALALAALPRAPLQAQEQRAVGAPKPAAPLTLDEAREIARRVSPQLTAAREAVAAAAARERQARAFPNPTLSYQREQASGSGLTNSQDIASIDQPLELGSTRGARIDASRLRREIAEARLARAQAQLDFDVTRAYALAAAADRRAVIAEQAATAFGRARTVSQARLVEGDVSGYSHRRVQLEAARYATVLAEARLERRAARLALANLLNATADSLYPLPDADLVLPETASLGPAPPPDDSLRALATALRADLRAAVLEAEAAAAEATFARRQRIPVPTLTAGLKREQVAGGDDLTGFVAGLSIPLPVWDRRGGAVAAADAESRQRVAETDAVRRKVAREVAEATAALRAVDEQLALLEPHLGVESEAALLAAQTAWNEGEITLVEWLDAVRAYQEAEARFASLRAESVIRRAALERAVGAPLTRASR